MAASSEAVDNLTDVAKAICQQQGLWSEWQPELFAGIVCYQQQQWLQSFKLLAASVVNGNIIAIDYFLKVSQQKSVAKEYQQFQQHHPKLDKHIWQLAKLDSPHALASSWLSCSDYYLLYTMPAHTQKQKDIKQAALKNLQIKAKLKSRPHGAWANFLLAQIFKENHTLRSDYLIAAAHGGNLHAMFALKRIKFFRSIQDHEVKIVLRDFALAKQVTNKEQGGMFEHMAKQTRVSKWTLLAANMGNLAGIFAATGIKRKRYDLKWLLHAAYLKNYKAIRVLVILLENKNPQLAFLQDERLFWNKCLYTHSKATLDDKARAGKRLFKQPIQSSLMDNNVAKSPVEAEKASVQPVGKSLFAFHLPNSNSATANCLSDDEESNLFSNQR